MTSPESDDDIGRLFSVPPADFVGERKATVKKLKAAGRRDEAAVIEKLPRPTLSVWAVNQIARQEPALVRRLADATAGLQGGNRGGASNYAEVLAAHRDVLKALRLKAEEILSASGLRSAPDLLTQVVHDLRAGISSPESRPLIESGYLVRDVADDSAVNPFAGAPEVAPAPRPQPPTPGPTAAPPSVATDDRAAREAARARDEARAFQRRRIENLRERVATAQTASERDERHAEAAARALKDAEERRELSRAALAQAVTALEAAEREIES